MTSAALPTRALYHEDGTRLDFRARVVAVSGPEVALDGTAFYPEGGGQPGDSGVWRFQGQRVAVAGTRKDKASGVIWHALRGNPPAVGEWVDAQVEAQSRWRHMQRHTGEHLLAQAFQRVDPAFQVASVSMSRPECTLDLRGDPDESAVRRAEELLRQTLARQELTLETPFVPEERLADYPLRRETQVRGVVRLVVFRQADGTPFDVSACGGTHVPRASQCAPVVVLGTERIKGGLTRVVFMAGEEASAHFSGVYRDAKALAQTFSAPVERLTEKVQALAAAQAQTQADLTAARNELARFLIQAAAPVPLAGAAEARFIHLTDPRLVLPVLSQVAAGQVLVVTSAGGQCGVSSGTPQVDASQVLRTAVQATAGKGGGKPSLAQGQTQDVGQFADLVRAGLTVDQPGR